MNNILFVKGESQYNAHRNYIDEIDIGFRLAGYNTIILDTQERSVVFKCKELSKSIKIDVFYTCNAQGIERASRYFPEATYITYLTDHPSGLSERLEQLDEKAIVFVCDKFHEEYIEKYFPNIKHIKFVPLSGSYSSQYIPYGNRKADVVFTGSYEEVQTAYKENLSRFDRGRRQIAEYLYNEMLKNPSYTYEACLERALEKFEIQISKEKFNEMMSELYEVSCLARWYFRDKVIRILLENGIRVKVYGNGWEKFDSEYKENLIIEKGNYYVAQKAVSRAKISLNIMPWFKAGFQERIASAMLSGTVAVTDESLYIRENFENGKELITYSLEDLEELPKRILYLLQNDDEADKIASTGKARAESEMTWQHRTFDMINFIGECLGENLYHVANSYGKVLQIPYENKNERIVAIDAIDEIDEILDIIRQVQKYDTMELCDVKNMYTKFLYAYLRLKANFPEVEVGEFAYKYIMELKEEDLQNGIELLRLECVNIQSMCLKEEYRVLKFEKERYCRSLEAARQREDTVSIQAQSVLIGRILRNYGNGSNEEMREVLDTIKEHGFVDAYNQKFVEKYRGIRNLEDVHYDGQADMHFVYWKGKRMYYPHSHSKEQVAVEVNFVNLEQDEESPHRYLEGAFQVEEGDIVIDAGVAEGNFALEIIEKAKKVYLIECEHEWVEALEKTFEPWKEKVVIIEKMLGESNDDKHASIDRFVEEGEVNFIKMDVEGAELEALRGASNILRNSEKVKCAICAYHRKNAEKDIKSLFEKLGYFTNTTKGYMFFKEDMDSWIDGELRRGVVRAVKGVLN